MRLLTLRGKLVLSAVLAVFLFIGSAYTKDTLGYTLKEWIQLDTAQTSEGFLNKRRCIRYWNSLGLYQSSKLLSIDDYFDIKNDCMFIILHST